VIAFMRNGINGVATADFVAPSPWELSKLAFLVALMGWMPAPIEISAVNSMWVVAKRRLTKVSYEDGLFDFNVGYIGTAILAVVFLALGALVQYGSPETVEMVGGKYIAQLINMYASTIGEWSRLLIAVIAFMCMFGTTITVIDGYSRTNVEALRILASIGIALVVTFVVLAFVSKQPFSDFIRLLTYPLSKPSYFGYVLVKVIPLTFAGLATLLYFRTNLFNLGTEGVFYISGIVATVFAINPAFMTGNTVIDSMIPILMATLFGGIISLIPGLISIRYKADEMVISLMMNSILFGIGYFILKNFLAVGGVNGTASPNFIKTARLQNLIPKTQVHTGFIIMIIAVIFIYVLLYKTKLGYAIRMTGINANFAKYSGMGAFGMFMAVHFLAGALGGMGSSVELLGMYQAFTWTVLPGLGFTGALMAMLGKNDPIGVLIAAFGISYLRASAQLLANDLPYIDIKMISIVEVILTLLISSQFFLRKWRSRQLLKEEKKNG